MKLSANNLLNKDKIKLIQKAILTGIGITASREKIQKAASGIYKDVQSIIMKLLKDLEESGEIKTNQTKHIIAQLQKKSESEKAKIFRKLQKEGKTLYRSAREIILTPLSLLKGTAKTLKKASKTKSKIKTQKTKGKKRRN
jgi:hypothetical protein